MSNAGDLAEKYIGNPTVKALAQLVPFGIGSAADTILSAKIQQIRRDRFRAFFDELADAKFELPQATAESEDFLHAFHSTAASVNSTRRREKIMLFARLLKSAFANAIAGVDEYEEMLSILDELSYRELSILALLARLERETTFGNMDNDLQRANTIWPSFEAEVKKCFGLEPEALAPILVRLQRSGCYAEITGAYFDYPGGRGRLTGLYYKLEALVGQFDIAA